MKIGAQLFTIRAHTQTAEEFAASMQRVAAMGYECVQVSAIGPIPAQQVADICRDNGLEIVITHTNPARIKDETAQVIAEHDIMQCKYIGIGAMPGGYERTAAGVRQFIADYTPAAQAIHAAGKTLMYHNHDFEFEKYDGKLMMDYLVEEFPLVGFTLDTYWVQAGGGDPAWWLNKLAGRIPVVHFKDMAFAKGQRRMAEVLEGNLNWPPIFAACRAGGVQYAMVEQDDCYDADPFVCLETSLNNLKKVL